jgi:hypothetical protein
MYGARKMERTMRRSGGGDEVDRGTVFWNCFSAEVGSSNGKPRANGPDCIMRVEKAGHLPLSQPYLVPYVRYLTQTATDLDTIRAFFNLASLHVATL